MAIKVLPAAFRVATPNGWCASSANRSLLAALRTASAHRGHLRGLKKPDEPASGSQQSARWSLNLVEVETLADQ